jgi:predicted metal-binding membrane protein
MSMAPEAPLRREQFAIIVTLGTLTVLAWAVSLTQMQGMSDMSASNPGAPSGAGHGDMVMSGAVPSGADHGGMVMGRVAPSGASQGDVVMDGAAVAEPGTRLILYLGMWVTMMAAMMLPAAAPMILMFSTIYRRQQERGGAFVPTWVFVAGYLAAWAVFGACAWALGETGTRLARVYPVIMEIGPRVAAVAIIAAAVYQFTPLKQRCLSLCRSPLDFVLNHWRPGAVGAWSMGLEHGRYCVGCCWVLFIMLVAVGLSSIPWMGLITLIILAEKLLPGGKVITASIALLLFGLGGLTLALPGILTLTLG